MRFLDANGFVLTIVWDPRVVDFSWAVQEEQGAQVVWLTPWAEEGNTVLSPMLKLPQPGLAAGPRGSRDCSGRGPDGRQWWKLLEIADAEMLSLEETAPGRALLIRTRSESDWRRWCLRRWC